MAALAAAEGEDAAEDGLLFASAGIEPQEASADTADEGLEDAEDRPAPFRGANGWRRRPRCAERFIAL